MRKITLWCIPGTFFLLACVLNWMGCIQGTDLADAVKPALLPLLCATSLAYLLGRDVVDYRAAGLLVAAPGRKPMASAPSVATLIRKSSSRASPCTSASAASVSVSQPTIR